MNPTPRVLLLSGLLFAGTARSAPAMAQQSANYDLREHVLNTGGNPAGGTSLSSASYRISVDAIGDGLAGTSLTSSSFRADSGFVTAYPPPAEVADLRFVGRTLIQWRAEKSAGVYGLYRGSVSTLPVLAYGSCLQSGIVGESATDLTSPPAANAYFYLVTVRNRLHEEGTKGRDSSGSPRPNPAPCP